MSRPVSIRSAARVEPIARGSRKLRPSSLAVRPLLIPAARKYAAGAAIRRSQASARHRPPPIAAPLIAAITGWCSRRSVSTMSSRASMARSAYVGRVTPAAPGGVPADSWSAPEQNPLPAPVSDDRADGVVVAELAQRVTQRHHHVEGHRVQPLGPVEGDDGDLGDRPVDQDELAHLSGSA